MDVLRSLIVVPLAFSVVAVGAVITMVVCLFLLPWRAARVRVGNLYGKVCGRVIFWLGGIATEKVGFEHLQQSFPAIYVCNHTTTMDGPLAMWVCPYGGCGVAKKELAHIPFFGWLYLLSGHLLIDRENRGKAIAAMDELVSVVKKNDLGIWIWPEGTRSKDGRLRAFKKGFAHMAIATGLPVVPIVVTNGHRIWSKGSLIVRPTSIKIEVLPAIDTSAWTAETVPEHVAEVWHAVSAALPEDQQPLAGEVPLHQRPLKKAVNA